jgi:hypothetical protein
MKSWHRWQDWVNVIAGIWIFATPWMFGYTSETTASWNAWTLGVLIAVAGLWALAVPESHGAEWSLLVLGVWVFVAPWILGVAGTAAIAWNAWVVGAIAAVLSGWVLLEPQPSDIIHGSPQHT